MAEHHDPTTTTAALRSVGFSGVSITYAIGSILGGAFAPTIAQALLQATGSTSSITVYLAIMTAIGLLSILLLRDCSGIPLGLAHEQVQAQSPFTRRTTPIRPSPTNRFTSPF